MPKRNKPSNNRAKHYTMTGINPIVTLLENDPAKVLKVMIADNSQSHRIQQTMTLVQQHDIKIEELPSEQFNQKFQGVTQGIAAEVLLSKPRNYNQLKTFLDKLSELKNKKGSDVLLVILDQIQDPHNLGAVLRTADAAGVDAVIMSENNSVPLNATVRKVASGGAENVPVYSVTNLNRAIDAIKDAGIWLVGTTDHAEQSIYDQQFSGDIALVMGSEGTGMRRLTEQACDFLVKLPMQGVVNSLNVSVATGICLYEINRQRGNSMEVTK